MRTLGRIGRISAGQLDTAQSLAAIIRKRDEPRIGVVHRDLPRAAIKLHHRPLQQVGPARQFDRLSETRIVAAVDGAPSPSYEEAKMSAYMKNAEIDITVDVGSGRASATVWTCDLTKRYIEINGDYRS